MELVYASMTLCTHEYMYNAMVIAQIDIYVF